ncbi:Endothiapepsin [Vanrija pseudolonga]|uniref:Endothiapepsin n=1 Tax=Vanrija pseudolonga TaxID=143232 RepID=A0AAF0Y9Q8_9TREE|nr:Endothiapepsin [Vanrija pseudolonga]
MAKWSALFLLLATVVSGAAVPQQESVAFNTQTQLKDAHGLKKIPVTRNPEFKANGTLSILRARAKYGFEPTYHKGPVNAQAIGQTPATPDDYLGGDLEYIVPVPIGTPAQTLNLDFDTGSSDLWVFSSKLTAASNVNHNVFTSSKSSTWKTLSGYSWSIEYADLSTASGTVGTDNVNLGGLVVKSQAVELATSVSTAFVKSANDGLVGLGFYKGTYGNTIRPTRQPNVVANLISQGTVPANAQLFTAALYSARDPESSFYTFGYVDQSLVAASGQSLSWTAIDPTLGFWTFPSTSAYVGGTLVSLSGNTAIADTGTTLAYLSDDVVDAFYAQVPGASYSSQDGGYIFPFDSANQLPSLTVAVGNKQFAIQPEDLVFGYNHDSTQYFGGIQSRGTNPSDILGDVFLKSVYVVFDQGNTRIGVVPKIEATQYAPSK